MFSQLSSIMQAPSKSVYLVTQKYGSAQSELQLQVPKGELRDYTKLELREVIFETATGASSTTTPPVVVIRLKDGKKYWYMINNDSQMKNHIYVPIDPSQTALGWQRTVFNPPLTIARPFDQNDIGSQKDFPENAILSLSTVNGTEPVTSNRVHMWFTVTY